MNESEHHELSCQPKGSVPSCEDPVQAPSAAQGCLPYLGAFALGFFFCAWLNWAVSQKTISHVTGNRPSYEETWEWGAMNALCSVSDIYTTNLFVPLEDAMIFVATVNGRDEVAKDWVGYKKRWNRKPDTTKQEKASKAVQESNR